MCSLSSWVSSQPRPGTSGGNTCDVVVNFRGILKVGVEEDLNLPVP